MSRGNEVVPGPGSNDNAPHAEACSALIVTIGTAKCEPAAAFVLRDSAQNGGGDAKVEQKRSNMRNGSTLTIMYRRKAVLRHNVLAFSCERT